MEPIKVIYGYKSNDIPHKMNILNMDIPIIMDLLTFSLCESNGNVLSCDYGQ